MKERVSYFTKKTERVEEIQEKLAGVGQTLWIAGNSLTPEDIQKRPSYEAWINQNMGGGGGVLWGGGGGGGGVGGF